MVRNLDSAQIGTPPMVRGGWLDALRFIAACLIVLFHFQDAAPTPLAEIHPAFARGYLLTNFFLIDSGYVLARIYASRVAAGDLSLFAFFRRRFLRVVPAHLLMATALVGIVLAAGAVGVTPRTAAWFDWSQLPAQIFLVQAYGVPGGHGWNAPTWSISALLGCYFLFPVLSRAVNRLSGTKALALGVAVYLAADALTWAILDLPVYEMPLRHGIWRALPLFFIGMVLARVSDTVFIAPRLAGPMGVAAAALLGMVNMVCDHGLVSMALIGVIILAAGAMPTPRPSRFIETAALAAFAIFITNEVVRIAWIGVADTLAARFGWSEAARWGLWAAGMGAALVFAFAFYRLVDAPSQKLLQKGLATQSHALRRAVAMRLPKPRGLDLNDRPAPKGYVELVLDKGPLRLA